MSNSTQPDSIQSTSDQNQVGQLMTYSPTVIHENELLSKAISVMDRECLTAIPVIDDRRQMSGILCVSDLVSIVYNLSFDVAALPYISSGFQKTLLEAIAEDHANSRVNEIMTRPVHSISEHDSIFEAAQRLIENHIHHLPVVDDCGQPIGMLSATDIVRAVAERKLDTANKMIDARSTSDSHHS